MFNTVRTIFRIWITKRRVGKNSYFRNKNTDPFFWGHTVYSVDGLNAVKYGKSRLEYEACDSKYVDLRVQGSQNSGVQESKDLKAQGFHNNPS